MLGFIPLATRPLGANTIQPTVNIAVNVTGVVATSSVGTAIGSIPINVPVTGIGTTGQLQGGVTVELNIVVPLSGWGEGSWNSGAWGLEQLSLPSMTSSVGTVTIPNVGISLTGGAATSAVGSVTSTGSSVFNATGVA